MRHEPSRAGGHGMARLMALFRLPGMRVSLALVALGAIAGASVVAWRLAGTGSQRDGQKTDAAGPTAQAVQEDGADWIGPVGSLEQLVQTADVIAVGKFAGIKGTHEILPDGYDARSAPGGNSPAVTFTLLVFEVERYIKGEGPSQLTVRQTGDLARGIASSHFPAPDPNQRTLVFLTVEPFGDDTWASVNGPYGRMSVRGGLLRYEDGSHADVPYLPVTSIDEAVARIQAVR